MKNVTGQVAQGDDFFDRDLELKRYWSDLDTDNLLLLAPRRVGKTSVMRRMQSASDQQRYSVVFVDVSDAADEIAFVRRLYQAVLETDGGTGLWNRLKESWLGNAISRVKKVGGGGFSVEFNQNTTNDWSRLGLEFADALSNLDGRWLIQIDELPVFVLKMLVDAGPEHRTRVREFLYWMRRMRLEYKGVRWMLAGSIGLDTVVARINLNDSINDLRIATLGAYPMPTAHEFLDVLGKTYDIELSQPIRQRIIDRIGWPIPYYLQLAFYELRNRSAEAPVTVADVDNAFEKLLEPSHRAYFDFWRQRLHDELGHPDSDRALDVLAAVSRDANGCTRDTLSQVLSTVMSDVRERNEKLHYLLDVLRSDGYLVEHAGRWQFRFPLLRDYWQQRVAP